MELPRVSITHLLLIFYIIQSHYVLSSNKQKSVVIDDIVEIKDFKQLLRTKTNVLVCFISSSSPENGNIIKSFKEAATVIKGHGTMVLIDCNGPAKKMCRKLKVDQNRPISLKHYKDGEFHKDYDRRETTSSIVNFMRDPTGSLPWDEDPTATDIIHLPDSESINRFLKKGPTLMKPSMIMFYAPWCGYCKVLKPEYAGAAADLKREAYLAAIDVARPENSGIRRLYNITGFPTLLYFENGQMKYRYEGDTKRAALVDFMRFPRPHHKPAPKETPEEKSWATNDSQIVHLTSETFDSALADKSALILFYAPWCGHCKKIKPEYEQAAVALKEDKDNVLAALDATKEPEIASKFGVKGYPTLKYFVNGEFKYDVSARDEAKIIDFMKNPQAPPPPEPQWSEEVTNVVHLQHENFRSLLKKKKHALIMFYAPWCGHCKKAKPEIVSLAENFKDDSRTVVGAVDCTKENALCQENEVSGYPTIKYYSFYDKVNLHYNGGRTEKDMTIFLKNPSPATASKAPVVPAESFEMDPNVIQLTDTNYEKEIKTSDPMLIMFYAPWCGHCKKMKPAFGSAAEQLKTENVAASLASVDCTIQQQVAKKYKIESYPTILLFKNGKMVEKYTEPRNKDELVAYMKRAAKHKSKVEL